MVMALQVSAVDCSDLGQRLFSVPIASQGREHMRTGSVEARSEQPSRNTPDLHPAEREHEGRGPGVQPPSEATPERTSGGGQDGGGVDDLVRSGSQGKS